MFSQLWRCQLTMDKGVDRDGRLKEMAQVSFVKGIDRF